MASITVNTPDTFDASGEYKVSFRYEGNQCIANRIVVYDSSSNAEVFNERITSFSLSHTIPAGTLTNGHSYYIKITAYYKNGNDEESVTSSSSSVFYCLATPTWEIRDITDGQIVANSSLQIGVNYAQADGDVIDEFIIVVYTASHTVFYQSSSLYDAADTVTVTGLNDDAAYYIRAYGRTVKGLAFDTRTDHPNDLIIHISYATPSFYSPVYLENIRDGGYVKVSTNVASIEGVSDSGSEIVYIDNEFADLRNDSVSFLKNIDVSGNFTLFVKGYSFVVNALVVELSGGTETISLRWRKAANGKCAAELKIGSNVFYSSFIDPPADDAIITIKVIFDGFYSVEVQA